MKKMEKKKIRIGELAEHLGVEKFVIRFWEREFGIKAHRSEGGQRSYAERDLKRFELIKDLLYNQGFTISGAKKHMKDAGKKIDCATQDDMPKEIIASHVTTLEETSSPAEKPVQELPTDISQQILDLQKKLVKLRELL